MARIDAIGMFWQDVAADRKRGNVIRPQPPIPETGWRTPTYFPDLTNALCIALDTETFDPELVDRGEIKGRGPGWARGKGHIIGVSIGVPGGHKWYFPIRHEIEPEYNLDPATVFRWLNYTLSNPKQPKVGANIIYDVGWLQQEGVAVAGELVDVQYAEALLDERSKVALEVLGQKYLGEGKQTNLLYQWCADFYGGKPDQSQRANLWRAPPRLVGPYAEMDADLPLRIAPKQFPLLVKEGLLDLFRMECSLIRLMVAMRFAGVSVNTDRAEQLRDTLVKRQADEQQKLDFIAGMPVDINSADSLARVFDKAGIAYKKTAKGKPSFTKEFLTNLDNPIANGIKEVRKLAKLRGTFVESYILNSHVNGKIYGQFHLLRSDDGGTRSGRLSSSDPNLQNLPIRDPELGPLIRALFVPDHPDHQWRRYDYSQIEYRFLAHFAVNGPHDHSADEVRRIFNEDPSTDYHEMTRQLVLAKTGQLLDRKPIKNINFGLIYGMGVDKLAAGLGLSSKEGKALFASYHEGAPFARATMELCSQEASDTGVITTILGRKSRFDLWEPDDWSGGIALPLEQALMQYQRIRRAYTHKALNRRLQGSAADMMKKAMLQCWNDGIFEETGVPRLTVHDELDFDDPKGKDEAFNEMRRVLETAIPLRVPIIADCEIGPDWGHLE